VAWIECYLLKGQSIWAAQLKGNYPYAWRKLLKMISMLKPHVRYIVGDGKSTSLSGFIIGNPMAFFLKLILRE